MEFCASRNNSNEIADPEPFEPRKRQQNEVENKPFDAVYDVEDGDNSSLDTDESNNSRSHTLASRQLDAGPTASSRVRLGSSLGAVKAKIESSSDSHSLLSKTSRSGSTMDYEQLHVTKEVRELFRLIDAYEPIDLELETPLKCFLPPYIPAIGEVDPQLKIPRPDGVPDGLGITILDEVTVSKQSNAAVIELQLRNLSKKKRSKHVTVRSIENASKKKEEIEQWIKSVEEIHASKPAPEVRYRNKMPQLEKLMQPWPKEILTEVKNGGVDVPSADIDLTLEEYARVMCSLFSIPVYDGCLIESIHVMLTLLLEFQDKE